LTSSPLNRAVETARLAVTHCQVELDVSFIEQDYGEFDGHPIADVPAQLWHEFRSSHGASLGGGESLADVDARVHARLDQMLEDSDSALHRADQHQVVVSHVSPIKSAVAWALGVDGSVAWRLRLDNASITTIAVRGGRPYLVTFNDVSARGGSNPIHR
jgi:probable phosphoglycerate mutase